MKRIIEIIIGISLLGLFAQPVYAVPGIADTSAHPVETSTSALVDDRAIRLKAFLASFDSPMQNEADHFVREADRLGLDWKLVAAIAGVESTFGHHVPSNSFNGWGWGIFTGASDGIHFTSWKSGITEVSEGLKYNYIDRGATSLEAIGRMYAASPAWSAHVQFFMQKIDDFDLKGIEHLAVTI